LRKQYIKEANKFYNKEAWNYNPDTLLRDGYNKKTAYIGFSLEAAGWGALVFFGDVLHQKTPTIISYIALLAGGSLVVMSSYRKRQIRKLMGSLLEKRTKNMDYNELERRVEEKDFRIPEPSEEERKKLLKKGYTERIFYEVQKKEHNIGKYAWSIGGICVIGAGIISTVAYATFPFSGPLAITGGGLMLYFSQRAKRKQTIELYNSIESFFDKHGFEEFQQYHRRQDPYDFYKRRIMPEIDKLKQKD
jgi:GNAT superfamily N-acetyltransferase